MTKYKTRYDPPDIYQALDAAAGLTDDSAEQADIAASLLGVSVEEAATAIAERAERARARAEYFPPSVYKMVQNRDVGAGTAFDPVQDMGARPAYTPTRSRLGQSADADYNPIPDGQVHPLDNRGDHRGSDFGRPSPGRRPRSAAPEVVVVRKTRPRTVSISGETRSGVERKSGTIGGKLRLNLNTQ